MNSVIATTKSAIYLAVKHIFPDVPINAGTFEPLRIVEPEGTFLYAKYPRPVSGCAAEVSQRIAEAVFAALTKAIPDLLFEMDVEGRFHDCHSLQADLLGMSRQQLIGRSVREAWRASRGGGPGSGSGPSAGGDGGVSK
jgi:N-methylhydantoinase B/oxoprolinase/acetone carboxylase alpha subunit